MLKQTGWLLPNCFTKTQNAINNVNAETNKMAATKLLY